MGCKEEQTWHKVLPSTHSGYAKEAHANAPMSSASCRVLNGQQLKRLVTVLQDKQAQQSFERAAEGACRLFTSPVSTMLLL